ncbi:hypothetical protein Tco_0314738, partial [Tanacetum coccineum]
MACVNAMSHDHLGNGAPPNKGIESPSKLLSLKYQSQSSLGEQNRNSSSPKRVHFVNTITIIRKEDEPKEDEIIEPSAIKNSNCNIVVEIEKNLGGEFSGSEAVVKETKSRDLEQNNPDDRACGDTKEVDKVEEESEESEEEVEEEEEEEDDPEYF